MKTTPLLALIVTATTPVMAQQDSLVRVPQITPEMWIQPPGPRTIPLNDRDGKRIGTATFSGNRIYLRHENGDLIAQIVRDKDGTLTMFDPNGKVLDQMTRGR
jgi:hypothetical protein